MAFASSRRSRFVPPDRFDAVPYELRPSPELISLRGTFWPRTILPRDSRGAAQKPFAPNRTYGLTPPSRLFCENGAIGSGCQRLPRAHLFVSGNQ